MDQAGDGSGTPQGRIELHRLRGLGRVFWQLQLAKMFNLR